MALRDQGRGMPAEEMAVQIGRPEGSRAVGIAVLSVHLGGPPLTIGPGQQAEQLLPVGL